MTVKEGRVAVIAPRGSARHCPQCKTTLRYRQSAYRLYCPSCRHFTIGY
jgi:NADH pyrophosphatase NudC (nudix superfamily)